jgi:hypothetical protein
MKPENFEQLKTLSPGENFKAPKPDATYSMRIAPRMQTCCGDSIIRSPRTRAFQIYSALLDFIYFCIQISFRGFEARILHPVYVGASYCKLTLALT